MLHTKTTLCSLLTILAFALGFGYTGMAQTTPDPGVPGPYSFTKVEYNLGDLAVTLDSFPNPVEVRGSVHYPTPLTGGPFPVIVLLHGRHSTCYDLTTHSASLAWPCPSGKAPIESFQGYDYHARFMASHGYIVISISCNAINAADNSIANRGMPARGQLVQHHLDLWNTYNTTGGGPLATIPSIGSTLVGKLDLQRIGTMGHSRGGEGVIFHALLNQSLGSPYGVKAVVTLAPVDFLRKVLNNIPLMNFSPYCDGDVSNLQGVHFYDDARFPATTDETPKHNVLLMGANHNFFNTVWTPGSYIAGTSDDWNSIYGSSNNFCGTASPTNGRFDTTTQKAAYNAYAAAFFRMYVGGETSFAPILEARDLIPPASSMLDTTQVFVSYHPGRTDRRDINRIDNMANETTNTMSGAVTSGGLVSSGICGGGLSIPACGISSSSSKEPHKGTSSQQGLDQMGLRWDNTTDWYDNAIPAADQDLSYVSALQFRTAQRFDQCTTGIDLDFSVILTDSAGNSDTTGVREHSHALFYQPGTHPSQLPKVVFNTVRIPIDSFHGIDKSKVRNIRFLFDRSGPGSILVTDLAFVNTKCAKLDGATFGYSFDTIGLDVQFADTITTNTGDTVTWLWNFGDPASGINDTSTAHDPVHVYTTGGIHTACLYIMAHRVNGWICTDTLCQTVDLSSISAVTELGRQQVQLIPNPTRDYIAISGANKGDILQLYDALGREVFKTGISGNLIYLPAYLQPGMYHVIVSGQYGRTSARLIINR